MQSPPILDQLGVNQGVNASPTLFGTYLADLGEYLTKHVGLCISDSPHIVDWWFSSNLRQRTDSEQGYKSSWKAYKIFAK